MKNFCKIIAAITLIALPVTSATAANTPVVLEIFTYVGGHGGNCGTPAEDEYHNADGTHKEGVDDNHGHGNEDQVRKTPVEEVFNDLTKEHSDIIALHYRYEAQPHEHDKDGNDIITNPAKINEELNKLTREHSYRYYSQSHFLDKNSNFQMVIGGKYKTEGTIKDIADAAIKLYKSQPEAKEIKMSIQNQNLEIEAPQTKANYATELILIGYKQKPDIKKSEILAAAPTINIVNNYKKLQDWDGQPFTQTLPISEMKSDGFAILAQDKYTGEIFAAGKAEHPTDQNSQ